LLARAAIGTCKHRDRRGADPYAPPPPLYYAQVPYYGRRFTTKTTEDPFTLGVARQAVGAARDGFH
jgi:hypothetical protein